MIRQFCFVTGAKGADYYQYARFHTEVSDHWNGKGSGGYMAGLAGAEEGRCWRHTATWRYHENSATHHVLTVHIYGHRCSR